MAKQFGLTKEGLVIPRYSDLLEMAIASYEAETGVQVNRQPGDALYSIFTVAARQYADQAETLQAIYDQQDPDNATGVQLDALCNISGIRRHRASFSTAEMELTGDPGITIPDGKRVEDSNRLWWVIMDAEPFDASGVTKAHALATEYGPHGPTPDSDAKIVNPVYGWQSATFKTISKGRLQESDSDLRRRRVQSLQIRGTGSCKAIRARLLALPSIKAAVVLENDTPLYKTVGGIPDVPPHSVVPVIYADRDGGRFDNLHDLEEIKQVARVLYEHVVAGVECYGIDQSGTVIGEDGGTKVIEWTYAQHVPITVEVQITGVDAVSIFDEANKLIEDYFETLQVGDSVRRLPILVAVAGISGVTDAKVLLNGMESDVTVSEVQVGLINGEVIMSN